MFGVYFYDANEKAVSKFAEFETIEDCFDYLDHFDHGLDSRALANVGRAKTLQLIAPVSNTTSIVYTSREQFESGQALVDNFTQLKKRKINGSSAESVGSRRLF